MKASDNTGARRPPDALVRLAYFFLSLFYVELIFGISTNTLGDGFWRVALLRLCGAAILLLVTMALPRRAANAVAMAALVLFPLIAAAQLIYFRIFSTFFTLFSAGNGAQVLEFFWFVVEVLGRNILFIVLLALPALGYALFIKRAFPPPERPWRFAGKGLSAACLLYLVQLLIYLPCAKDPTSPFGLAMGQGDAKTSVSELGLFATMQVDMYSNFVKPDASQALAVAARPETPAPPSASVAVPSPVPSDIPVSSPSEAPPAWLGKYNELDIDFAALAEESAANKALTQLHNYFAGVEPTNQNEYTGIFKGYNLIYMTCEGFSHLAVDRERTPLLYKMQHEGVCFTDCYNPAWGVSTTDGEYASCMGLLPKPGVWSFYKSAANYVPFTMGIQLKSLGYRTNAYHNHTYDYYRRDLSHPNMGYDYKAKGKGLDVKNTWPESDVEMMQKTVDEYIGSEPFHAYYMTVSGHLQYTFTGNYQSGKHRDAVADLPYSDNVKAYLACQMELEYALEYIMERLEEAGIAERTLFAFAADHYPYGLTPDEISELEGHKIDQSFEMYKNAMIIYAKGMEPVTVDAPVSSIDLLPTVSNLLGLPYDSRLLSGRDVFSDSPPLVMFTNRSFITDKGVYNSKTKAFAPREGVEVGPDYVDEMSRLIEGKFAAAAKIIELDYFGKIAEYLPQTRAE